MTMTAHPSINLRWPGTRRALVGTLLLGSVLLAGNFSMTGCATTTEKKVARASVFYPPLPNSPRIQYLATFSTTRDLTGETGGFASFVLGEDVSKNELIEKPYGVAYHNNKLYVVDLRGPGYAVFDFVKKTRMMISGLKS